MTPRSRISALLLLLLLPLTGWAANTTRPARTGYLPNPPLIVERFRNAISTMDLTVDQRAAANALLDKADQDAASLAANLAQLPPPQRFQKVMSLVGQLRQGLSQILSPTEQQELLQKVRPQGNGQNSPPIRLFRLQQALQQMDLSDDQKQQISAMFQDIRQQGQSLRAEMQAGQDIRQQLQDMSAQIRKQLGQILTPNQRQQLRRLMPAVGDLPGSTTDSPVAQQPPPPPVVDKQVSAQLAARQAAIAAAPPSPQGQPPVGVDVGDVAPDFTLSTLNDSPVTLSKMKGRPVVLEFGSYTSPSFRDRAVAMERMRRQFGANVTFLIVYTREAHAKGEWEVDRNSDAGISIDQPQDMAARRQVARQAVVALHLLTPVVVDSMKDTVATEYGGMPNALVVIDRNGRIAARQHWADPSALPDLIASVLSRGSAEPSQSGSR